MNKYLTISFLICYFSFNLSSQDIKKDSLLLKLQTATQRDKLKILVQLSDLSTNYIECINFSSRALIIANEIKDINYQANININIGKLHFWEGKHIFSEKRFLEALGFYQLNNDSSAIADCYYWLSNCNKNWGKYLIALKYAHLSLDLNQKIKSTNGIIEVTILLGNIYQTQGNQNQALIYFNDALKIQNNNATDINSGLITLGKGNVFLASSMKDSAKFYLNKSYQIFLQIKNIYGQAIALRDLAHFFISAKDYKNAESKIDKSLKLLESINRKKETLEVLTLKGDLYFKKGNYKKAIDLYQSIQKQAIEIGLQKDIAENYKRISKAYEAEKDLPKAMKFFKLYSELKDSVLSVQTFNQLSDMQIKYDSEKKIEEEKIQKSNDELKQTDARRHLIIVFLLLAVLSILFIFIVTILNLRGSGIKNKKIIQSQKQEIELSQVQNKECLNYAIRIQNALLAPSNQLNNLKDYFILYKPRDIVGGDFYWMKQINNQLFVVAADCTGHGTTGAFMTLLGISLLSDTINGTTELDAVEILEKLRKTTKDSLHQEESHKTTKDGIDLALCIINTDTLELQFAGANMPLYLLRKGRIEIFKGINNPIGIHLKEKPFENIRIQLKPDDIIYLFSDGFVDQFGGKNSEKFKPAHFRNALLAICSFDMNTQKKMLEEIFDEWKNTSNEQTDDVLVLGLKF